MTLRASKPAFNVREKLTELGRRFGLKGSELAAAETVQEARDLVSAGRKNLVINGAIQFAQRATSASTTGSSFAPVSVDRFSLGAAGGNHATYTAEQSTDAPDGFIYSFKVTTTSAASATTGYQRINYSIEGYDAAQIGYGKSWAKTVTASFWVKSNNPGTYSVAFNTNGTSNRFFSQLYTINQSDTWEYKTITIPGDTVDVSQNTTNGHGLYAAFALRASSTYTSGTNYNGKWIAQTDSSRHVGHNVDVGNTNGDYWAITGYQVELGSNATDFEHRSHGEELLLCQRYYYKSGSHYHFLHKNGYYESQLFYFPTTMRTDSVTVNVPTPVLRRVDSGSNTSYTGLSITTYADGFYLSTSTSNNSLFYTFVMSGSITADAEL